MVNPAAAMVKKRTKPNARKRKPTKNPSGAHSAKPLTAKDLVGLTQFQIDATLTMRFDGLPTAFVYSGLVQQDEDKKGTLGGVWMRTFNNDARELPDVSAVGIALNFDQAEVTWRREPGRSFSFRWGGGGISMHLILTYDGS